MWKYVLQKTYTRMFTAASFKGAHQCSSRWKWIKNCCIFPHWNFRNGSITTATFKAQIKSHGFFWRLVLQQMNWHFLSTSLFFSLLLISACWLYKARGLLLESHRHMMCFDHLPFHYSFIFLPSSHFAFLSFPLHTHTSSCLRSCPCNRKHVIIVFVKLAYFT
jgi:hypothetical protein